MKSLKASFSVTFVAATFFAMALQAGPPQSIRSFYSQRDAMVLKGNLPGYLKVITDNTTSDFTVIRTNKDGTVSKTARAQFLSGMRIPKPEKMSYFTAASRIGRTTISKSKTVVEITQIVDTVSDKWGDGKQHRMVSNAQFEDTWVKSGATWKLQSSKTIGSHMTVDGKPAS